MHGSITRSIDPSTADSVREKGAVAAHSPTSRVNSYSYNSTSDESETYSDVETEDDEEDPQLKNKFYVLTAPVKELRTAPSMAAPAGRTPVKATETIKTAAAAKSAHSAVKPYVATSSSSEEQEEAKSSTKCLRAASSAHSSRKMKKVLDAAKHAPTAVADRASGEHIERAGKSPLRNKKKQRQVPARQHELVGIATLELRQERDAAADIRRRPIGRGPGRIAGAGVTSEVDPCSKGRCHAAL